MPPVTEEHLYTDHVHPWEEIVDYVSRNEVSKLRRNRYAQEVYQKWTSDTLVKYGTVENFLLKEKLHWPKDDPKPILVLPNDFPYSVDPGIEHVLIWSKEPLVDKTFIESLLDERYGATVWEWVYFVNPPELQSIPTLPHMHVFMRKRI
ncbi:hypothetical protein [Parasitella parasitica]|uniref:Uncharacterized protein n=1 Tax=Parasitella parasitica TaxID=35722 RepID=A0A0B7NJ42_9FUNG|nr:hypothetical protein [Parasitella parasitica]